MLVLRNRLIGIPIMSLQTGARLGLTAKPIIDPRNLTIVAFYCEGPQISFQPAILHVEDIREFSELGFIIDSADDIMPPDDLVRLQEVLDFKFELEGKNVVEEKGHKLGKVTDYSTEVDSFYIIKLHVRPSIWQSFGTAEHIVDRTQIQTVTDKEIIVGNATITESHKVTQPPLENPFRKTKPAQTIDSNSSK